TPAHLDCIALVRITKRRRLRIGSDIGEGIILFFCARLIAGADQAFSPDASWSGYRNVFEVLTPDQTVVPVAVTKVLILVPLIRLRRIVFPVAVTRIGREDGRAVRDVK